MAAVWAVCLLAAVQASAGEVIKVFVNQAHILRLQQDAGVVMVATPAIANVSVESPRLIFIFGLELGETNLYVLDAQGGIIIDSALVVVPIDERQVTINRPAEETTLSCAPRCATVGTPVGSDSPAATAGGGGGEASATSGDADASGAVTGGDRVGALPPLP